MPPMPFLLPGVSAILTLSNIEGALNVRAIHRSIRRTGAAEGAEVCGV